jgi:hypothetical protein
MPVVRIAETSFAMKKLYTSTRQGCFQKRFFGRKKYDYGSTVFIEVGFKRKGRSF